MREENSEALRALRRQLLRAGLAGCGLLLGGAAVLTLLTTWPVARRWLLASGVLWGFVWWQTWRRLALNRASDAEPLCADLGHANRLTLLRGGLIAATGGFLLQAPDAGLHGWLPALLYSLAVILDRVDGYVARRDRQTSLLGGELDTIFDALGLLVAPLLAVAYGKIHWSYLLVSAAYYCFVGGLYWRRRQGLPVFPLAPSSLRRSLAGFQMGLIAVVLWPPFHAELTRLAGVAFMLPVLAGFAVDWLVVSGRLDPRQPAKARLFTRLRFLSAWLLQPGLRALLALTLWQVFRFTGLPLAPISGGTWSDMLLAWALLLSVLMIAAGVAGQAGALLLLLLLAWQAPDGDFDLTAYVVIFSAVWILLLGTGRFSLWRRDAHWINRHDG
jgi:CDP-diacylglycerol--glycerol-3-phosphate 3-phosphatidyltransferase